MPIRFMTTREVAVIFRKDRCTIARWCGIDGRFPSAIRVGRAWLIPEAEVLQLAGSTR